MLQLRTIEPSTLGLLKRLNQEPLLADNFLVGGTSLALQLGHRFSVDLDMFTQKNFDADLLLYHLEQHYTVQPLTVTKWYAKMFRHSTSFHVLRSLTYFVDAEHDVMPIVFDKNITWEIVKAEIIKIVQKIGSSRILVSFHRCAGFNPHQITQVRVKTQCH